MQARKTAGAGVRSGRKTRAPQERHRGRGQSPAHVEARLPESMRPAKGRASGTASS